MHALLNSSHGTHGAIIITKTVTGRRLKGPDRRTVGDRAPPRDHAVQHTTHYITPHCLICTLPTHNFPIQANRTMAAVGELHGWSAPDVIPMPVVWVKFNRGLRIVKVWSASVHGVRPKIHVLRQKQYTILSLQYGHIGMLPSSHSHSTNIYDKMITNCNITVSNDSVISCDNIQFNHSFLMSFSSYHIILDKKIKGILSTSVCGF